MGKPDVKAMEAEISAYVEDAENQMHARKMKDVMVTDHQPKPKKLFTTSEEEDQAFYEYNKALEEYNADASAPKVQT